MKQSDKDLAVAQTVVLITSYSFDLQGYTVEDLISKWLTDYHSTWIRLATIEALYLGRYKAISIEQIMGVWSRLGSPKVHFGGEFERLICRKLPRHLVVEPESERVRHNQDRESNYSNSAAISDGFGEDKPQTYKTSELSSSTSENSNQNTQFYSHSPSHQLEVESSPSRSDTEAENPELKSPPLNGKTSSAKSSKTIEEFTPIPDMSSLFQKLKAIAENLPDQEH